MTRPLRVLVADDERNLRELIIRELGRRGHDVDGAADGVSALGLEIQPGIDINDVVGDDQLGHSGLPSSSAAGCGAARV